MRETTITASAIISFTQKLEDRSAALYERLAALFTVQRELFQAFAGEDSKNKKLIVRTYQETITDALEACYAFEGMRLEDYEVNTEIPDSASYADALGLAIGVEEKACEFYLDVAERSQSLLATIPMAFKRVAKKRNKRKSNLQALLHEESVASLEQEK